MLRSLTFFLLFVVVLSVEPAGGICLPCQARFGDVWRAGLASRGMWSPSITNPRNTTVWMSGTDARVTWSLNDMPQEFASESPRLLLGTLTHGGKLESLDLRNPLARGFPLCSREITFVVPYVKPGRDYIIALLGDSGNRSPPFRVDWISA